MDIKSKVPLKCSSCGGAKYIDDPYLIHDTWFVDVVCIKCGRSKDIELKSKVIWKIENQYGLLFIMETSEDFENISYIINNEAARINK